MTTQCEDPCAQFPIHEFDRIGSELARKSTWYAKMTIELDRITAPNYHPTPTPLTPARSGFIYKGIFEPCRSDRGVNSSGFFSLFFSQSHSLTRSGYSVTKFRMAEGF